MSDQTTPPKPKVGSLRDRIAAFEKSATSAAPPAPAPAPRPKPAGFASWKPKAPSPPSSPAAATTEHAAASPTPSSSRAGGMSATDAKESITKAGGSLKERMAALQGKGAFGAPPPVAPKPAVERPKWKPPPVVQAPDDDDDHSSADIATAVERTKSPPVKSAEGSEDKQLPVESVDATAAGSAPSAEGENEGEATPDPEEEERQRRAAIAARMARLGGARMGMAPPVIGKKPPVRRPTQEGELKTAVEEQTVQSIEPVKSSDEKVSTPADSVTSPPPSQTQTESQPSSDYFPAPVRKNSENVSILSVDSIESHPAKSPSSMPVPAVPRRAGPPRKKPAKPTAPPPEVLEEKPEELIAPAASEESEKAIEQPAPEPETVKVADSATSKDDKEHPDTQVHETEEVEKLETSGEPVEPFEIHDDASKLPELSTAPVETQKVTEVHPDFPSKELPPATPAVVDEAEELDDSDDEMSEIAAAASLTSPSVQVHHFGDSDDEEDEPTSFASLASPPAHVPGHPVEEPASESTTTPAAEESSDDADAAAEEEARKKRVAERMAKMGGLNPFAPPPARVTSPPKATPTSPPHPPPSASLPADTAYRSPSPEGSLEESSEAPQVEHEIKEVNSDGEDEASDYEPELVPTSDQHEKLEAVSNVSHSQLVGSLPPPPIPAVRPPIQGATAQQHGDEYSDDGLSRNVLPNPAEGSPAPVAEEHQAPSLPGRPAQPPRRIVPQAPEDDEYPEEDQQTDEEADERLAQSHLFIRPPTGSLGPRPPVIDRRRFQDEDDGDGDGSENDSPALPILHRRSMEVPPSRPIPARSIPQPPPDDDSEPESDHDGRALPVRPPHTGPPPKLVPPPPASALDSASASELNSPSDSPSRPTPSVSVSDSEEILDDEEGDPIDPAFYSPSRQTSHVNLFAASQAQAETTPTQSTPSISSPPAAQVPHVPSAAVRSPSLRSPPPVRSPPAHSLPPPEAPGEIPAELPNEQEEDPEQARRKTIADRMARLGGIKFGASPIPTPTSHAPPAPRQEEEGGSSEPVEETPAELTEEEEERARKERIAAKMAHMGGMRIGMMPMGMGGFAPQRSHALKEETPSTSPPPSSNAPPTRATPPSIPSSRPPPRAQPPPQPPQLLDTDSDSVAASEDGIKVEAEESEIEEVNYEDAEPEAPPVPSRSGRATHRQESSSETATSPRLPPSRPPVPTSVPPRRSSIQTTRTASTGSAIEPPARKNSSFMPQSEYVMVEEPESQEAPPPPPRPSGRPVRSPPQAPYSPLMSPDPSESISSQWELPSIPTPNLDFGAGADLSLSWTDAAAEPTSPPPPAPPEKQRQQSSHSKSASDQAMTADDLMMVWGRVGVQVCEVATTLFEKSKKTLIGDGSYAGFLKAVLGDVPNAAAVSFDAGEYGYLIYVQNGTAVQKRVSDIMPGDIIEMHDAKLKGHKGLQTYHQNVGAGEILVGIVGEFEAKKSKVRVFQANQHVGQQTVESVSYRLEDLKSGAVKVYRVLEA